MVEECRIFAFRWLLPITQLLLCSFVLLPVSPVLVQQVSDCIRAYRVNRNSAPDLPENQALVLVVPLSPPKELHLEVRELLAGREWIPQTLNLPCGLVQLPYVILNPARQEWVPRGMNFRIWRVISWPLMGILFWWIAGRGIEALIAARQRLICPSITWIETITGAALCVFCGFEAVSMSLLWGSHQPLPMKLFVAAFGMWAVLGGGVVAARLAQWRLRRALSLHDVAARPAPIPTPLA